MNGEGKMKDKKIIEAKKQLAEVGRKEIIKNSVN